MARQLELEVSVKGIDKVNSDITKLENSLELMKQQLQGMDKASPEFQALSQSIQQTETQLKSMTAASNAANTSIDAMGQSAGEAAQEQASLNQQIGDGEDKLMLMAQAGDTSSAAYKKLLGEVGAMKKVQMETNVQIDRAAAGFAGKLTVGVQRVAAAYQVGMAATQMFGVESEKAQKIMAQLQAVMAFTQGIEQLKQLTVGMKLFGTGGVTALSGIKKAIIATGIGALVVAVGMLVAYWDDIVGFIGDAVGASSAQLREQEKLVATAKQNVGVAEKQMEQFSLQENSLRLQGKSEKDILKLRLERINAVIVEQETYVAAMEQKSKLELEAARQNQETVKQVIRVGLEMSAFTLRMLAAPIDAVIETANAVAEVLGFSEIVSTNLNELISEGLEAAADYGSKFFVDTDALAAENKKLISEEKSKLDKLKSDRDGLKLQIQQIEKQEVENSVASGKEKAEKLKALREQQLEVIKAMNEREREAAEAVQDATIAAMEDGAEKQIAVLEEAYGDERQAIIDKAIEGEVAALDERFTNGKIKEEEYLKELATLRLGETAKLADDEIKLLELKEKQKESAVQKIRDEENDKKLKRLDDYQKFLDGKVEDADEKARISLRKGYADDMVALKEFLDDKTITQAEYDAQVLAAQEKLQENLAKINDDAAKKERDKRLATFTTYITDLQAVFEKVKGEGNALITSLASTLGAGVAQFMTIANTEFEKLADPESSDPKGIVAKVNAYAQAIGSLIQSVLGAVQEEQAQRLEQGLENVETTYNRESELLEQQKANGLITEEAFTLMKYKLDVKRFNEEEKLKKKAFESEKKMRIASAIIAGLQGAVAAFAGAMTIPPPAGPILGAIMAGLVGAMTAANIAQISAQKYEGGSPPAAPQIAGDSAGAPGAMESPAVNQTTLFGAAMTGGNEGGQQQGAGLRQQPMRAYVLETDITNSQNTISTYEQRSEIG